MQSLTQWESEAGFEGPMAIPYSGGALKNYLLLR
jgi:hypothetical protein